MNAVIDFQSLRLVPRSYNITYNCASCQQCVPELKSVAVLVESDECGWPGGECD